MEYRLKGKDSLTRKILSDSKEKLINVTEASKSITDVLRYTVIYDTMNYTDNYFKAQTYLEKNGYETIRAKNTFKDGVHTRE